MAKQIKAIEPEFLGVDEAEIMTGRSRWSWRKDAYAGRIASVKLGRRLLIPVSEIRRVVAAGMRPRVEKVEVL
jgi:hypothetical protein